MEVWKDLPEYRGLYQISNEGRVKSCKKLVSRLDSRSMLYVKHPYPEKIKTQRCTHFYLKVNLCKYGMYTTFNVHNLVALVFIGKRPIGMFINHKDGNKHNNYANNLEYVTVLENNWNGSNWDGIPRAYGGTYGTRQYI